MVLHDNWYIDPDFRVPDYAEYEGIHSARRGFVGLCICAFVFVCSVAIALSHHL